MHFMMPYIEHQITVLFSFQLNYAMSYFFHHIPFVAFISRKIKRIYIRQSNDALPTTYYMYINYISIETTCGAVHTVSILIQSVNSHVCVELFFPSHTFIRFFLIWYFHWYENVPLPQWKNSSRLHFLNFYPSLRQYLGCNRTATLTSKGKAR